MSLKFRSFLVLAVGIALGFSISLTHTVIADRAPIEPEAIVEELPRELPYEYAELITRVLEKIRSEYVQELSDEELFDNAIRGIVGSLDPHSAFLSEDEYEEVRITTSGSYSGVGLEVSMDNGLVRVISPIDDTPAKRAGILPGDLIVEVNDTMVTNDSLEQTIGRMRGMPGTTVKLTVRRLDFEEPIKYELTRALIQVSSVRWKVLEDGYAYLRISQFSEHTGRELVKAVRALDEHSSVPIKGLILDLRNNPGGVLESAVSVSDAFLNAGALEHDGRIVRADGRIPEAAFTLYAEPGDVLDGASLIVLVNQGSASASEIVAGALQDHHRGVIMGTTTYGKGSVQTVSPLPSGRAIKLTTAHYYTPAERSIHKIGIVPDVILDNERVIEEEYGIDEALAYLKRNTAAKQIAQSPAPTNPTP